MALFNHVLTIVALAKIPPIIALPVVAFIHLIIRLVQLIAQPISQSL